MLLKLNHTGHV